MVRSNHLSEYTRAGAYYAFGIILLPLRGILKSFEAYQYLSTQASQFVDYKKIESLLRCTMESNVTHVHLCFWRERTNRCFCSVINIVEEIDRI